MVDSSDRPPDQTTGPVDAAGWLTHSLAGITRDLRVLRAELHALAVLPPALRAAPRAVLEDLRTHLAQATEECTLVQRECARLTGLLPPPARRAGGRRPPAGA